MATDKTEVPVGKVVGIGLLTLGTLVAVHYSITSYFYSMYGAEDQRKVLAVESRLLQRTREDEARRLANVDQAMQQVAGSAGTGVRPAAITPQPSNDLQALQGWQQRPRVVPNPPPARGDLPAGAERPAAPTTGAPTTPAPGPAAPGAPVGAAPTPSPAQNPSGVGSTGAQGAQQPVQRPPPAGTGGGAAQAPGGHL